MVGIKDGVSNKTADVQLCDIVVSRPIGTCGGVVQYKVGKIVRLFSIQTDRLKSLKYQSFICECRSYITIPLLKYDIFSLILLLAASCETAVNRTTGGQLHFLRHI
jgi:hypothetical protein